MIPQCIVFGRLLFIIYTSGINSILNIYTINYHMYAVADDNNADDIQLYASTNLNNLSETITKIHKLTIELNIYFNNNYLQFNQLKT